MGEEMEGAVQQAAQAGLQFMGRSIQERDCLAAMCSKARIDLNRCVPVCANMPTQGSSCRTGKKKPCFSFWVTTANFFSLRRCLRLRHP